MIYKENEVAGIFIPLVDCDKDVINKIMDDLKEEEIDFQILKRRS